MSDLRSSPYTPVRASVSRFLDVRGLRLHVRQWGDSAAVGENRPPLVLVHGFMDVSASFQFMVDALTSDRQVLALDLRGFGLTESLPVDNYWLPDYLGDLDAALDTLCPDTSVDLLGHSMGGGVVMLYAGVRPERIRKLVNIEGFGMQAIEPEQTPSLYRAWLDQLKTPQRLRSYPRLEGVAERLRKTNPRLPEDKALWLGGQWARQETDGEWHILGDPAHKRIRPIFYRKEEVLACWRQISAPTLWVEGLQSDLRVRRSSEELESRLAVVPRLERVCLDRCGHMVHHDQPEALARHVELFLD